MQRSFTRRQFVKNSLQAGTLIFPLSLGIHLVAGNESTKESKDELGVMLVGCGSRGGSHLKQFMANPRTRIACLCDADQSRMERMADVAEKQQGSRPKIVRDMREGLLLSGVDIVTCAAPNHWHALCGIWAMQAGKDLYLEKPICHNLHEGKALLATAKKYNRLCQVGTQFRSFPSVQDGIAFVRSGGIGDVRLVRGLCYKRRPAIGAKGAYPVPAGVDYNLWSGPAELVEPMTRPQLHYDWHWQRNYGNGDLGNQGPHQTDISRCLLGVDIFPQTVVSYGGRLGYLEETKNPSYCDAGDTANTEVSIFNYPDNKTLVFETRGLPTDTLRGASIGAIAYGSEGYFIHFQGKPSVAYDLTGKVIREFTGIDESANFTNFITCVLARTPEQLAAPLLTGHLSAGLSHLGNISWYLGEEQKVSPAEAKRLVSKIGGQDDNNDTLERTFAHLQNNGVDLEKTPISFGSTLSFDAAKETFIDNPAAVALETRNYREDFVVPELKNI